VGQLKYLKKGKEKEMRGSRGEQENREKRSLESNLAEPELENNRELYNKVKIAIHNINGLKNNHYRLQELLEFGEKMKFSIIGIVETNIKEIEAKFIGASKQEYYSWWSSAEYGKHKGSGVGILVNKIWSRHLIAIRRPNAYSLRATFCFRKIRLIVWVVYMPPSDKKMQKELQRLVTKDISGKERGAQYIIGGDFNKILDPELDTTNRKGKKKVNKLPLIKWIQSLGYEEVFRRVNPTLKKYTWANKVVQTRIDQIWVSGGIKEGVLNSDIEEMYQITGSDHNLIWGEICTHSFLEFSVSSPSKTNKDLIPARRIYLYKEASEENWENYRDMLENSIGANSKKRSKEKEEYTRSPAQTEEFINQEWDRIVCSINRAAAKYIPSKLSKCTREEKNKQVPRNPRYLDVKNLKRMIGKFNNPLYNPEDEVTSFLWNCQIREINIRHETQVPEVNLSLGENWAQSAREWTKVLEKKIQKEEQRAREKMIIENIEKRYGMIGKSEKQMLNSILERPWKSILIEKILVARELSDRSELILDPELVKNQVDEHFQNQFRKRRHKFEELTEDWKEEYQPKSWIKQEWYEEVMDEITEEDWYNSLSAAKANTAPGISGISYILIRRAGPKATKVFLFLINTILKSQIFPRKWKIGQIFPIPKMTEWDLSLGSTRPIMLLETFRKSLVRIIQIRLSGILVKHKILKGMNFAGLPGESTSSPIHIINNLLEDAKQKNRETWVLLQDIKKAFDSVSMESIRHALHRINVPENLVSFILEIFNGRKAQVITKFGLTKGFQAEDGIDQGEVISPLIWRIIYDPLLVKLQELKKGYRIQVKWPNSIKEHSEQKLGSQIAAVAYADDTTFIADSKENLQKIIDKAQEFYDLNDIEINPKKSELLVLNREKGSQFSIMHGSGREEIKAKKIEDTVRLLGVWIGGKNQKRKCRNRLHQEVKCFTQIIRAKRISIEQIKYLNNKVLLPRLEYRSMIYLWPKKICDKIHQPMLRVAKWKAGLASTCSNATIIHDDLLGIRTFWQRHIEHMLAEWLIRVNCKETVGQTCLLRLREAQLEACDPDPIWEADIRSLSNIVSQNNLNKEILVAARELNFSVQAEYLTESWSFAADKKKDSKIISILQEANWKGSLKSLRSLKVWYIDQLLDTQGKFLLTWQQLRKLQDLKATGKKASWFIKIEELVLIKSSERMVKEVFQVKAYNNLTTEIQLTEVSRKRSRKEWVVSENNKENEYIVGKVQKKRKVHLDIIPWLRVSRDNTRADREQPLDLRLIESNMIVRKRKNSVHDISKWIGNKEGEKSLSLQIHHITDTIERKRGICEEGIREERNPQVRVENWDSTFIRKVIEDCWKQEELIEGLEGNKGREELRFFTDGSYISRDRLQKSSLGYGIVQVDAQNSVIREIKGSMQGWFSSTRPELRAILEAILISPGGSSVLISTDSQVAIDSIYRVLNINKARTWLKTANSSILTAIKEAVNTKGIQLTLLKVKAHSGLEMNDRADKLAKESAMLGRISKVRGVSSEETVYKPLWQGTSIEIPFRSFIKEISNTIYKAEWTFLRGSKDSEHRAHLETKDWRVFRLLLLKLKKLQSKSLKEDQRRSFALRCFSRSLPTLERRKLQRPDLYTSALCIKCLEEVESFEHLTSCSQDISLWEKKEESLIKEVWNNLSTEVKGKLSEVAFEEALKPETHQSSAWRSKLARGFIERQYRENLQELGLSKKKASEVMSIFLEKWLLFFQEIIWKKRCITVIEWEKSLNIKLQDKRKKKARKKTPRKGKNFTKRTIETRRGSINIQETEWQQTLRITFKEIKSWIEGGAFSSWNKG
jgi:ribonuclease HI/exonuclease III